MRRTAGIWIYASILALAAGIAHAGAQSAGDPSTVRAMEALPGCDFTLEDQGAALAQTAMRSKARDTALIVYVDIHDTSECERKRFEQTYSILRDMAPNGAPAAGTAAG